MRDGRNEEKGRFYIKEGEKVDKIRLYFIIGQNEPFVMKSIRKSRML